MSSNGNGTYSIQLTVKTYIALGTYEVRIKAMDSYGTQTGEESLSITLKSPSNDNDDVSESGMVTIIAGIGLGLLLIVGGILYVMRGSDEEGGLGGFGNI